MIRFIKKWFKGRDEPRQALPTQDIRQSGANRLPTVRRGDRRKNDRRDQSEQTVRQAPRQVQVEPNVAGRVDDRGPVNVLVQNKYQKDDEGTNTLRILDESMLDSMNEAGNDPYNSGSFDRSKNWEKQKR